MKVAYKYKGKEYTADLLYYEMGGMMCEDKDGKRYSTDHYVVEHKGNEIDLSKEDIVNIVF